MKKRMQSWSLIVVLTMFFAGVSHAADDVSITKDLTAVIALLGLPCGKVVSAVKKGDNDHIASCENGSRYRIFLNSEGRVVGKQGIALGRAPLHPVLHSAQRNGAIVVSYAARIHHTTSLSLVDLCHCIRNSADSRGTFLDAVPNRYLSV